MFSHELIEFRANVFSKFKKYSYENITFKKVNYLDKKEKKEKIILYLGNQSITIREGENGYKELLEKLSNSSKQINTKKYDFKFIIVFILAILIITPIILFARKNYNLKNIDNDSSIEKEGFITISGILIDKEYGGKGSSGFKRIVINPFNTFKFIPNSNRFDVDNFYKKFKDGDSVKIYISPNEFKKKITKKDSLTFHDKYFSYNYITFYGIENSKYKFIPKK